MKCYETTLRGGGGSLKEDRGRIVNAMYTGAPADFGWAGSGVGMYCTCVCAELVIQKQDVWLCYSGVVGGPHCVGLLS